ncbi:MAG: hypothetical protein ABW185_13575, partial [Sedimenticola sp.]
MFLHGDNSEIDSIFSKTKDVTIQNEAEPPTSSENMRKVENETPNGMTMGLTQILSNVIDLGHKYSQIQTLIQQEGEHTDNLKKRVTVLESQNIKLSNDMEHLKTRFRETVGTYEKKLTDIAANNNKEMQAYLTKTEEAVQSISIVLNSHQIPNSKNQSTERTTNSEMCNAAVKDQLAKTPEVATRSKHVKDTEPIISTDQTVLQNRSVPISLDCDIDEIFTARKAPSTEVAHNSTQSQSDKSPCKTPTFAEVVRMPPKTMTSQNDNTDTNSNKRDITQN